MRAIVVLEKNSKEKLFIVRNKLNAEVQRLKLFDVSILYVPSLTFLKIRFGNCIPFFKSVRL